MRLVTLYTASKKQVTTYGDYVPIMTYDPPIRCRNSPDIFIKSEVDVHHATVQRFVEADKYGYNEQFVALDPSLKSIVDVLNSKSYNQGVDQGRMETKEQVWYLQDEVRRLQSRTIWSMIADKFKRSK